MPKYKLAEYRYGREEMLALYIKDNKVRPERFTCCVLAVMFVMNLHPGVKVNNRRDG